MAEYTEETNMHRKSELAHSYNLTEVVRLISEGLLSFPTFLRLRCLLLN